MLDVQLRRAVRLVALFNLAYFGIEFAVATAIGSVSLFADSVDFLEDAAVNFLIFAALGWSMRRRAKVGKILSLILLAPALALLWTLWHKFNAPTPPAPVPLSLTDQNTVLSTRLRPRLSQPALSPLYRKGATPLMR